MYLRRLSVSISKQKAGSDVLPAWRRHPSFRRRKGGEDATVGNAAFSRTAILEAAQLGCKPSQVGNFGFDFPQVVFRDAIDAQTFPPRLNRETQKIPELVEGETQVAAAPDELQAMQVFTPIDSVVSI